MTRTVTASEIHAIPMTITTAYLMEKTIAGSIQIRDSVIRMATASAIVAIRTTTGTVYPMGQTIVL